MVCIIRSKYQKELKQLSGILGGEKAAHYALCMNNGYNLTDTKEGKHSKLFDQLKEKYGEDEAIRMKTYTFTPQFTDQFGDWYNDNINKNNKIIKNATVIWGHPGTGKTWLFKQGRKDIIDFDSEYKSKLGNLEQREKLKKEIGKQEYNKKLDQLFDQAKQEARETGKKLLVSDMHFLRDRADDLDAITNISDKEFIQRSHQRGEHDEADKMDWKKSINKAMLNAPKDKVINTTGYISNLLDDSKINKIDENGEPKIEYVEKLYNEYNDDNFSDSITFSTLGYESNLQKMKQVMQDEGEAIDSAVQQSINTSVKNIAIKPGESLIHFFKRKNVIKGELITDKVNQIMQKRQQVLAQHYGLKQVTKDDGSIEYSTDSKDTDKQILVKFVNSLGDKRGMYREAEHTLYISLINADPTTMNHELAHYYVRTFWQSKEVQKALSIFDDKKLSSRQLEERLVEEITSRTMAENFSTEPQKRSIIQQFWNSFKNLLNRLILGKMTESKKNDILDSIAANFYLNKQLEQDYKSMAFYDKYNGDMFQQGDIPNANDLKVYETISTAVKRRYSAERAQKAKDTIKIQTLRAKIKEYQEDIDLGFFGERVTRSTDEQQEKITSNVEWILDQARRELNVLGRHLSDNRAGVEQMTAKQLFDALTNVVGYYEYIFNNKQYGIFQSLGKYGNSGITEFKNGSTLYQTFQEAKRDLDSIHEELNTQIKEYLGKRLYDFVQDNVTIGDKDVFYQNVMHWLYNEIDNGSLNAFEKYVGIASSSKSQLIRIVDNMIQSIKNEKRRNALTVGHEFVSKMNKLAGHSVSNYQARFCETDSDGKTTGYWVRPINYGQYYKEKKQFVIDLAKKFGLNPDLKTGRVDLSNVDTKIKRDFLNGIEDWVGEHAHRRYKAEYYKKKREFLSDDTMRTMGAIQRQINVLLSKQYDEDGYFMPYRLGRSDRDLLERLQREKQQLSNFYDRIEVSSGEVKIVPKTGDALRMAEEIHAWYNYINGKIKYKPNIEKYNAGLKKLQDQLQNASSSSEKLKIQQRIKSYVYYNSKWQYTEDFQNLLNECHSGEQDKRLAILQERRRKLLIPAKDVNDALASPDLQNLTIEDLKQIQYLDEQISRRKLIIENNYETLKSKEENGTLTPAERKYLDKLEKSKEEPSCDFNDIAAMDEVKVRGTETTMYDWWENKLKNEGWSQQQITDLLWYTDRKTGESRVLSCFFRMVPKVDENSEDELTLPNGRKIKVLKRVPGNAYSELDETSELADEEYDKTSNETMQPKKNGVYNGKAFSYENKQYSKLTEEEKDFLNNYIIKKLMWGSNEKIAGKVSAKSYRMPQIHGNSVEMMWGRGFGPLGIAKSIGYAAGQFSQINETDTEFDMSMSDDLAMRPDGTKVGVIPIRYIKTLDDPEHISTDVIGSVMSYWMMAENFRLVSQLVPDLELIHESVNNGTTTDTAKVIREMIDTYMYDKHTKLNENSNKKMSKSAQRLIKSADTIRKNTSRTLLSHNYFTIMKGFVDASKTVGIEALTGKYITVKDIAYAHSYIARSLGTIASSVGKPNVHGWLAAAMQYNDCTKSIDESFSHTQNTWATKFLRDNLLMGGYTVTDFMVTGMICASVYHHFRLVHVPIVEKVDKSKILYNAEYKVTGWEDRFVNQEEAMDLYYKAGLGDQAGMKNYENAKITLHDAYIEENSNFVIRDEFKDKVTKRLEDIVSNAIKERSAVANGMMPENGRHSVAYTNPFARWIMVMRGYLPTLGFDRFKAGSDFSEYKSDKYNPTSFNAIKYKRNNGEMSDEQFERAREYYERYDGQFNFNTATVDRGQVRATITALRKTINNALQLAKHLITFDFDAIKNNKGRRSKTYNEKKMLLKSALEIGFIAAMGILSVFTAQMIQDLDDDDDDVVQYATYAIALLNQGLLTESSTAWVPNTVLDLFTSPTTVYAYLQRYAYFGNVVGQLAYLGLTTISDEDDASYYEDVLGKNSSYAGRTKLEKDLIKLSPLFGIPGSNLYENFTVSGLKGKYKFYSQSVAPNSTLYKINKAFNGGDKKSSKSNSNPWLNEDYEPSFGGGSSYDPSDKFDE